MQFDRSLAANFVVARVVVDLAVELRGAGLGDAADVHAAGAVLGREVRALDLHFLNHVVVQGDDHAAVAADVDEVEPSSDTVLPDDRMPLTV